MDYISIENLQVFAYHGVYEEENINGQNFYVSAKLFLPTGFAGKTDDINASVNYADVCHKITEYMTTHTYNLIEAVAENLAYMIFSNYESVKEIELTISKPEAPIGLPFDNVSVTIHRKWTTAFVAYGSNMGDSLNLIQTAIDSIRNNKYIRLIKESSIIKTKAYGYENQDDFYNGCVEIETLLSAEELLEELNMIENAAGRKREIHWGPRTLDLDIILFGNEIINSEKLIIPHYDMHNRMFVLEPLCEIAPYAYNPRLCKTAKMLKTDLERTV